MSRSGPGRSKLTARLAATAAIMTLVLSAGASFSQEPNAPAPLTAPEQNAPRVIIPVQQAPLDAMPSAAPAASRWPHAAGDTGARRNPYAGSAVQVGDLGTVEGPVAGTLDNSNGGLGGSAWQASERFAVVTMLQNVPASTPSAAYRMLMRKVLLTAAPPPPAGPMFLSISCGWRDCWTAHISMTRRICRCVSKRR
jgi:hypothetical protein